MLSTGAASLEEIEEAISVLERAGTDRIVVMHCNLKYPTDPDEINLGMIKAIQERFGKKYAYGLSDHTRQVETPSFAFMLGANIVEKHYTIDKTLGKSADHWLSVDPDEVREIVRLMNVADVMFGVSDTKQCTDSEKRARLYARRSVVSTVPIAIGNTFTKENIACKRPGTGISPKYFDLILGKKAIMDIPDDKILEESDISGGFVK